jgi:hypothetical protein
MNLRLPFAAFTLATLGACSGGPAPEDAAVAETAPTAVSPAPAASEASRPEPQGDCDLLTASEISAAFGGKLTVRRTSGRGSRGSSCTYTLAEVPDSQIILQAGDLAAHEAKREAYAGYRGVKMIELPIGKEAFLVNGAQVIALRDDGQSISLGLTLIVFDAPMPLTEEEIHAGVASLAGSALARL